LLIKTTRKGQRSLQHGLIKKQILKPMPSSQAKYGLTNSPPFNRPSSRDVTAFQPSAYHIPVQSIALSVSADVQSPLYPYLLFFNQPPYRSPVLFNQPL
jgi:hypothetical protein